MPLSPAPDYQVIREIFALQLLHYSEFERLLHSDPLFDTGEALRGKVENLHCMQKEQLSRLENIQHELFNEEIRSASLNNGVNYPSANQYVPQRSRTSTSAVNVYNSHPNNEMNNHIHPILHYQLSDAESLAATSNNSPNSASATQYVQEQAGPSASAVNVYSSLPNNIMNNHLDQQRPAFPLVPSAFNSWENPNVAEPGPEGITEDYIRYLLSTVATGKRVTEVIICKLLKAVTEGKANAYKDDGTKPTGSSWFNTLVDKGEVYTFTTPSLLPIFIIHYGTEKTAAESCRRNFTRCVASNYLENVPEYGGGMGFINNEGYLFMAPKTRKPTGEWFKVPQFPTNLY
jgi:hypothetical protein